MKIFFEILQGVQKLGIYALIIFVVAVAVGLMMKMPVQRYLDNSGSKLLSDQAFNACWQKYYTTKCGLMSIVFLFAAGFMVNEHSLAQSLGKDVTPSIGAWVGGAVALSHTLSSFVLKRIYFKTYTKEFGKTLPTFIPDNHWLKNAIKNWF